MNDPTSDLQIATAIGQLDRGRREFILRELQRARDISPQDIYDNAEFKGDIQQGDILLDMPIVDLPGEITKRAPCVVLSNACDLVRKNKRAVRITYTPILRAEKYKKKLKKPGEDQKALESYFGLVKAQKVNKLIWLPPSEKVDYEGLLILDYILSARVSATLPDESAVKEQWGGSMTLAGWYFLISKLVGFYYRPTDEQLLYRLALQT